MFESDMPAKRQFTLVPSPETLVRTGFTVVKWLVLAAVFWFGGAFLWHRSIGPLPWEAAAATTHEEKPAATPSSPKAQAVAAGASPAVQPEENIVETAAALQERLAVSICQGYGLIFDGADRGCVRPPPPKAYSAEGIRERAAPVGEAVRAVQRMVEERTQSETWKPSLRLQGFLHEPGEPCRSGGHRDGAGLMCVFTDEERAELRRYRR